MPLKDLPHEGENSEIWETLEEGSNRRKEGYVGEVCGNAEYEVKSFKIEIKDKNDDGVLFLFGGVKMKTTRDDVGVFILKWLVTLLDRTSRDNPGLRIGCYWPARVGTEAILYVLKG